MIFEFHKFLKDITILKSQNDFSSYLESCFIELEEYLLNITDDEIQNIKFDIEDMLYDLLENNIVQRHNSKTINAFLILLAEKFLQTSLKGAITIISDYLPSGTTKQRLEVAKIYLNVNDITTDYFTKAEEIITILQDVASKDEYNIPAIKTFLLFYNTALKQFQRTNNILLTEKLSNIFLTHQSKYSFLQDLVIDDLLKNTTKVSLNDKINLIHNKIETLNYKKIICTNQKSNIPIENSKYSSKLYSLKNPTFNDIRQIAFDYIKQIGDLPELYSMLQRGEAVIKDERLLYKYLVSFGGKHKEKLYSAFDIVIDKIKNETINLIDWGCGQAFATMLLLNYAKEKNIVLDIKEIILIEPSSMALSRGLLHLDILKQSHYSIRALNLDIDCLDGNDLIIKNNYKTLHFFSNILDVENFSLDFEFFKKISDSFISNNIFLCVSPNRNDKLNNRLDLFYQYFDENFDVELISSRDTSLNNSTRYEKIFEVQIAKETKISNNHIASTQTIQTLQFNPITQLENYGKYIVPILDLKILEDSINSDPEYAIFKIRKVAEVITSKIYSNYEPNGKDVSFNDKIRYLSYEKKVFGKDITNYVQTIRTIGNRGVHEENKILTKMILDANLMAMALVGFLNELVAKKLLQ